jgi:NAD(P) transhydrogenase subunit alpha
MDQKLSLAINEASEISVKANILMAQLQELDLAKATNAGSGVDPLVYAVTVFILASFVGYYVVWKVTPSLHTPLMSLTNAVSGIIIIGALIAAGPINFSVSSALGYVAVFIAAINIFGGFVVTERMLDMFRKK